MVPSPWYCCSPVISPLEWHPLLSFPNAVPAGDCVPDALRAEGTYHRVWIEPCRHTLCRCARIMDTLPLSLSEIILLLWWY